MKRKSILMMIVALLFAGTAMAQNNYPWWDSSNTVFSTTVDPLGSSLPAGVNAQKVVYFCLDSLVPVELGYDVAHKDLSPSYGDWELIAVTKKGIVNGTIYDFGAGANGGAGNTFKVMGSDFGGYLFQYTAKDALCGLGVGEKYWIIVFIMPSTTAAHSDQQTFCPGTTYTVTPNLTFQYDTLYHQAGFTGIAWNPANYQFDISTIGIEEKEFTLTFTIPAALEKSDSNPTGYKCGTSVTYRYKVTVQDITADTYTSKSITECEDYFIAHPANTKIKDVFNRHYAGGSYATSPAGADELGTLLDYTLAHPSISGAKYRTFEYTYTLCAGGTQTIYDTLVITTGPGSTNSWGQDTVAYCRSNNNSVSLYDLYIDKTVYPGSGYYGTRPTLNPTASQWNELGIWTGSYGNAPGALMSPDNYMLDPTLLNSSIGYHYKYTILNGATCFENTNGTLVVILQDPFVGRDYRAQVCTNPTIMDVNAFAGVSDVTWTVVSGTSAVPAAGIWTVGGLGMHVLSYASNGASACGTPKGKLYLKVVEEIKIAKDNWVKFCLTKLPATINLNTIAGVSGNINWVTDNPAAATAILIPNVWNAATGTINVAALGSIVDGTTLKFKAASAGNCLSQDTTISIEFSTTL